MQVITDEAALRALNEAVRVKGHDYVDKQAKIGATCQNVVRVPGSTTEWMPSCIVGTALVWLGVPVEWFPDNDCYSQSIHPVSDKLRAAGLLDIDNQALALFAHAQSLQDSKAAWGDAVVEAHLGVDWFESLDPRD